MVPNILIVDDEEFVLKSLQRVFRREGYNIYVAESAAKAIEILEDIPVDLILTDQRMPQMTGTELLKAVKARSPGTVRIILSGYADVDAVLAAINEGEAFRFITKPWEDNALRTVVRRAIEQGRVIKIFNRLLEHVKEVTPDRIVQAESRTDEGRVHAVIQDHGTSMDEAQISCMLKCIMQFFASANEAGEVATLSHTLTKFAGKLSFSTEVGVGARLTIDMPIDERGDK